MSKDQKKLAMDRREFLKLSSAMAVVAGTTLGGSTFFMSAEEAQAKEDSAKGHKWAFVIDLRRCIGCKACVVSCKTENHVALGRFRNSVKYYDYGTYPAAKRGILPWLCNHCDDPLCIKDCPADEVEKPWGKKVAATYKRPDGIVVIDQDRCIGCGNCVRDCPYGVRFMDPFTKAGGDKSELAADKCDLCQHRLEKGLVPSCVNTCPPEARAVVDLNNPNDPVNKMLEEARKKNMVRVLMPEKKTKPQCFYIDPDGMADKIFKNSPDNFNKMNKKTAKE